MKVQSSKFKVQKENGVTFLQSKKARFTREARRAKSLLKFQNSGFTLAELVIAMALVAIVGTLLIQLLVSNNGLYLNQSTKVNQGIGLNNATPQIQSDIKSASSIALNYPEIAPFTYTTSVNTLVLKIPSIDSSENVITNLYDFLVITKDSTNPKILRRIILPTSPSTRGSSNQVLINDLSLIKFRYLDDTSTQVSTPDLATKVNFIVNVSNQVGLSNQSASSSGEVNLRNN